MPTRTMEGNVCDVNHLDADVRLPPRKRLLAGLKKQSSEGSLIMPLTSTSSVMTEFDVKLNDMLRSQLSKSPEEIVEASRSAAENAVKTAKAARAVAEEKAVAAAKAMAAAKSALDLVALISENADSRDKSVNRNKTKTQGPVQMLQNKKQKVDIDEEVARNLHRVFNNSPRNTNSNSDSKSQKYKRLVKSLVSSEKMLYNGELTWKGKGATMSNEFGTNGEFSSAGYTQKARVSRFNGSTPNMDAVNKMVNGGVTSESKGKMREALEDPFPSGRKRGRIKQKKLPLSICNFRDQANPKEEVKYKSLSLTKGGVSKDIGDDEPLGSKGPSDTSTNPSDRPSTWKCKVFKAADCAKQNEVMQLQCS